MIKGVNAVTNQAGYTGTRFGGDKGQIHEVDDVPLSHALNTRINPIFGQLLPFANDATIASSL